MGRGRGRKGVYAEGPVHLSPSLSFPMWAPASQVSRVLGSQAMDAADDHDQC